ncbi:MAG TPA: SH3 domain-containing protein [Allocoleopsis sp.]
MKSSLLLLVFLGSIVAGCQSAELAKNSSNRVSSPAETANPTSAPATTQTPQSSNEQKADALASTNKTATPAKRTASSQRTCQISAYVTDKDPKGLNVRSGPGSNYAIVGNLPTNTEGVIVEVSASQGDWVQVTKAESPNKVEFQGTGWVYAPLLGTSTRGYGSGGVSVYPSANTQGTPIGRIPASTGVKLLSCEQSWALVEHESVKGWIAPDDQCGNPLTTCP